jgi:hypothetical protein
MEELACTMLLTMAIRIAFKLLFLLLNQALLLFLGNFMFHSEDLFGFCCSFLFFSFYDFAF